MANGDYRIPMGGSEVKHCVARTGGWGTGWKAPELDYPSILGPISKQIENYDPNAAEADINTSVDKVKGLFKERIHAYTFLDKAVEAMKDRAAQRDIQNGGKAERSMAATVAAFNGLRGRDLTEEEGWEFMILLKMVRGHQGSFRDDDYIDGAAYFGLLGECASASR